jgi:hypothetical protein
VEETVSQKTLKLGSFRLETHADATHLWSDFAIDMATWITIFALGMEMARTGQADIGSVLPSYESPIDVNNELETI